MGMFTSSSTQSTTNLPTRSLTKIMDKASAMYMPFVQDVLAPRAGLSMKQVGTNDVGAPLYSFNLDEGYMSPLRESAMKQGVQSIALDTNRGVKAATRPFMSAGLPGMGLAAKQRVEQGGLRNTIGFQTQSMLDADNEQTARLKDVFSAISGGVDYGRGYGRTTTKTSSTPSTWDVMGDIGSMVAGYMDMQTNNELSKLMGGGGGGGSMPIPTTGPITPSASWEFGPNGWQLKSNGSFASNS